MERGRQVYASELHALQETNSHLQRQQIEASVESTAILQKQSELYKELCTLQETKSEVMDLCRQYENAYNEERERRQADREQIKKLRVQSFSESESAVAEANSIRKQLSVEKRTTTRLSAENKSLKAQVSFLEQKLRDSQKGRLPSPPKPSWKSERLHTTYTARPQSSASVTSLASYAKPRSTSEEFYSQLQHEFDASTSTQIPIDAEDTLSHTLLEEENIEPITFKDNFLEPGSQLHGTLETQLSSTRSRPSTVRMSLAASSSSVSAKQSEPSHDRYRISELKSRNRRVQPHLKSSYAVELQVQPESPSISNDSIRAGKKLLSQATSRLTSRRVEKPAMDDILTREECRKRTTTSRKTIGDLSFSGSPMPTRRRISAPLTPQTSSPVARTEAASVRQASRRATMAAARHLRPYLDREEENLPEHEGTPGAMFELNFSPPRAKVGPLPERLKQRLSKKEKPANPAPSTNPVPPVSSRRGGANKTVVLGQHSQQTTSNRRSALKTKN